MLKTSFLLRTTTRAIRLYSTQIPFDKKPFPFSRFEPCCPDVEAKREENGFVPCQNHPIPEVLGKKIELKESMNRPDSLRHLLACVGPDALEWTRAKVESVPESIISTIMNYENQWIKTNRSSLTGEDSSKLILTTISDKPPIKENKPDIMLFPEFKLIPSVDPASIQENTILANVLDHIWKNPKKPFLEENLQELQDIKADTIVLVCNHARRDLRCGKLGPLIIDEFSRIIQEKGLSDKVQVWGTSHFGGKGRHD
jgi:hypothetical protein